MTPQRWAQIEELFHRAWECDPARRARLLDEFCSSDTELRSLVQSLLASGQEAANDMQAAVDSGLEAVIFPLLGETLSHYRILGALGGGGMGTVYCAEDVRLGRRVAVKVLAEELTKDPTALDRFEREARSACALEHPNICPIYEFGDSGGQPFLVMPLLEGATLRELLSPCGRERAPLALGELLDLALQIAAALDAAHRHGIIHRDIKPANVFVTVQGQAEILDFGLAKPFLGKVSADKSHPADGVNAADSTTLRPLSASTSDSVLTRVGATMGTAGYMSPEQARGEPLDARTDIFSFGLVLYEMATGHQALSDGTFPEPLDAVPLPKPPPLRQLNPALPARLQGIIRKALEQEREARYQTAAEMRADLTAVKQAIDGRGARRSRLAVVVLIASLSIAAAASWFAKRMSLPSVTGDINHRSQSGGHLNNNSAVVVADFTNTTGDTIFNGTLQEGLSVQLEQSPFLRIVSDQQIKQTLAMMGQHIDAKLSAAVARELCERTSSTAVLDGSIAQVGTQYVLTLKAVDCASGESLAGSQALARDKDHVLEALGKAAFDLRQRLGESLTTAQRFDTPLEQATTSSLEALQSYTFARKQMIPKGDNFGALSLFRRAIQLDPNFALAYATLGTAYDNLGDHTLAVDNTGRPTSFASGSASEKDSTSKLTTSTKSQVIWKKRTRFMIFGQRPIRTITYRRTIWLESTINSVSTKKP